MCWKRCIRFAMRSSGMSLVLSWVICVSLCAVSLLRLIPLWRWLIRRLPVVLICWFAIIRCSSVPFMRCRDWVSVVRLCVSSIVPDVRCGWGIRMPMRRIVASAWLRLTCSVWWISVRWCPSMIRMPSIRSVWGVWGVLPNLWRCVISPVE